MQIDRRQAIAGGMAALTMPGLGRAAATGDSLGSAAGSKGIRFGSAIGARGFADKSYRELIQRECNVVTPENAMKWQALRPDADRFTFDDADAIVGWATRAGLEVRGHTLLWPRQDRQPAWVLGYDFGSRPGQAADELVGRHVATVVKRYASRIRSFDVVNEAVDPETGALRESVLSKASGGLGHLIALAFQLAREAAPKAQLVYNDYMDWGTGSAKHRAGVLRLLEGMRKGDVPCDALGIQAHVTAVADLASARPREREWRAFLDEVTGMGYALLVTECDVDDRDLAGTAAERDRLVADYARVYADILLSYRQLDTFVTWGLSDRFSWLDGFRPRADGQHKRGCPYDSDFRPKRLRAALLEALGGAAVR